MRVYVDIQVMFLNVVIVLKVQRLTCPKGGALTPITIGVAFELMQDSTVILLDIGSSLRRKRT